MDILVVSILLILMLAILKEMALIEYLLMKNKKDYR